MLNAITCVWNEEDIIAAAVKNCFAQGCDNVFIVDNASTDNTVPRALEAGARLAISFESKFFDERQKIIHLNAAVSFFNNVFPDESIWWLYFDADEFPCIANGSRLADLVAGLDPAIIGLHGYLIDHIPTHAPYNHEGRHPADFMPLCEKTACYKIPLLRYDKGRPHFFSAGGAHDFNSNGQSVLLAMDALDIHHFPFRNPKSTLTRLKKLLQRSPDGSSRVDWMDRRNRYLNKKQSHYYDRYESMREHYQTNKFRALQYRDLSYDFKSLRRWYDVCEDRSCPELDDFDNALCRAVLQYFLGRYDVALCRFNDALNAGATGEIALWITVKMAECFAYSSVESDAGAARLLLTQAHDAGNSEVSAYIEAHLAGLLRGEAPVAVMPPPAAPPLAFRVEPYQSAFQIDPGYMHENMRLIMDRLAHLHG